MLFPFESAPCEIPETERDRLEAKFRPLLREELRLGNLVSYQGNKTMPILRLFRYKEAFAFEFVRIWMKRFGLTADDYVFDPFAGMGTTLFAAMLRGIPAIGVDRLPVATFVARVLLELLFVDPGSLRGTFEILCPLVDKAEPAPIALDVPLMKVAFSQDNLKRLRCWKSAIDTLTNPWRDIFLLLFFAILEPASYTSNDGQFLRLKKNKRPADPDEVLLHKVVQAEEDLVNIRRLFPRWEGNRRLIPTVVLDDARDLRSVSFASPPTAIITSPPYANRYDYTRSYCLELCFHFVRNFQELKALRHSILRSHIEAKVTENEDAPHPAVEEVVASLHTKELNNPRIPVMLIGYFNDMEMAIQEWSRVLAPGAQVAMVVDNVRFEGEHVPVDLILSEMAEAFGFKTEAVIVTRYKGNSSQQMRKYGRMPVRESVVVWRKQ